MRQQNLTSGYYWTYKKGSVGKVLSGTLKDADGPFEITGSLVVTISKPDASSPTIDEAVCDPDPDQVTNKGKFTFTVDSAAAAIAPGTYNIEFKHTDGGVISFWPDDVNSNKTYGKLVVTKSL